MSRVHASGLFRYEVEKKDKEGHRAYFNATLLRDLVYAEIPHELRAEGHLHVDEACKQGAKLARIVVNGTRISGERADGKVVMDFPRRFQ